MAKRGNPAWVKNMSPPNPKGRPKIRDLVELKKIRRIRRAEAQAVIQKWIDKPMVELKNAMLDPNTPSLECMIISTILFAIQKGDQKRLDWIFTQLLGRIPITLHDLTDKNKIEKRIILELPKSKRIKEHERGNGNDKPEALPDIQDQVQTEI